jgi:hypothetical protein
MTNQEIESKLMQAQRLLAEAYEWVNSSRIEEVLNRADDCIWEAAHMLRREEEHERIEAAIQQEMDEDAAAEAAWREIQEEEAGRIEAQEREWAEDEGRDPAELTSIDVLGKR